VFHRSGGVDINIVGVGNKTVGRCPYIVRLQELMSFSVILRFVMSLSFLELDLVHSSYVDFDWHTVCIIPISEKCKLPVPAARYKETDQWQVTLGGNGTEPKDGCHEQGQGNEKADLPDRIAKQDILAPV